MLKNKLTVAEKINKTLDYCDYVKDLAHSNCTLYFKVEIENTYGETETEDHHAVRIYRRRIGYTADTGTFLRYYIWQAVLEAQKHSFIYKCLSSVKIFIETHEDGAIVDEEPVDEYEINYDKGSEV